MVNLSAKNNQGLAVGDASNSVVYMYDWSSFLGTYFSRLPNILKYHQICFYSDGRVSSKYYVGDSECITHNILKCKPSPLLLPPVIPPKGLDLQRQWYLYDQIRDFCKEEWKDEVCPLPALPKPGSKLDSNCSPT